MRLLLGKFLRVKRVKMVDVFNSLRRAAQVEDPYPHLVAENALPDDVADALLAGMPPLEAFT
jgi:hypothetical protein